MSDTPGTDHYPAEIFLSEPGIPKCACGAAWPCQSYIPATPQPAKRLEVGDPCPSCTTPMETHKGHLLCRNCEEEWLGLPNRSQWLVLYEGNSVFVNNLWIGQVEPDGSGHYLTWLLGRGYGPICTSCSAGVEALLDYAEREWQAHEQ